MPKALSSARTRLITRLGWGGWRSLPRTLYYLLYLPGELIGMTYASWEFYGHCRRMHDHIPPEHQCAHPPL